jgi:hypothetical protein
MHHLEEAVAALDVELATDEIAWLRNHIIRMLFLSIVKRWHFFLQAIWN